MRYSSYGWNGKDMKEESTKHMKKIREVEKKVAIMNRNRPPSSDDLPLMEDIQAYKKSYDMMRGTVFSPSFHVDENYSPPKFPKTQEQRAVLHKVLEDNFLFSDLRSEELEQLIDAMQQERVENDVVIIQQGDTGDFFYVVESGRVRFVLDDEGDVGFCDEGGSFGELALLYDSPRAASCIASSATVDLWKVDQKTFRYLIAYQSQQQTDQMKDLLKKISLFKDLAASDLNRFSNSLTPVHWKQGARIVEKGEEGNVFYIIQDGKVKIHDIGLGDSTFEDQTLGPGSWFGERALLTGEPRAANVTALSDVTTMAMDRETFETTIGPMKVLMERELRRQYLRGLPMFANANVTNGELNQLVDLMQETCYDENHKLAEEGKPYQLSVWIIRQGKLLVTSTKHDKKCNLKNGDHFGDKSLLGDSDHISGYTAVCEEPLTAWSLSRDDIESVLEDIDRLGKADPTSDDPDKVAVSDLTKRKVLGQGAFGKVWLVSHNKTGEAYALKEIGKLRILESKQLPSVIREKAFLCLLQHPFILNLVSSFQDESNIYLLLPVIPGGELFSVLHNQKERGRGLNNEGAAFYSACILEALGHFHQQRIAYRDLKLENVMIDAQGYCRIVDLGFAKVVEDKTYTLVGTPEYLAPEIIMSKGHDVSADYWAYGVLVRSMKVMNES